MLIEAGLGIEEATKSTFYLYIYLYLRPNDAKF